MSTWLITLQWMTFAWLLGWVVRALLNICSADHRSVSFLLLIFFLLYGIPIGLDLIRGIPEYTILPGFRAGASDESVVAIYDLFVAACPLFWWLTGRPHRRTGRNVISLAGKNAQRLLWLLLCSPLIAVVFAPQPSIYTRYATVLLDTMSPDVASFQGTISALALISVVAAAGLLLVRRSFAGTLLLVLPFVTIATWLQGKRTIVALAFVLIWVVAWIRGFVTRSRVLTFGAVSVLLFGFYVTWYQGTFRPRSVATTDDAYENLRIDYGRDHTLKAAIFCELSGGTETILDYRGQSVLFSLLLYVPRSFWPEKPWPYAVYMTAYALQIPLADFGWGITSSLLDEAVANFGWAGLLIGPLVFTVLCQICDKSRDPLVRVVGVLMACLLMSVEFVAFAPLMIIWVFYLCWSLYAARRAEGSLILVPIPARQTGV